MLLKRFFISMLGSLAAIWISAMLLILLGMTFAIGSIISFAGKETAEVKENSILRLDLSGVITEQQQKPDLATLLRQESMPQTLGNIVDAIAAAKNDKNIEGLYIRCNGAATGLASFEAIRNAVADFRSSGKWTVAYADGYTQGDYYVASAAEEVYLNPVGEVAFQGLATGIPFMKGLLDKVGVEMQVVKVGTFKSAVEPFLLDHMSEANRLQTHVYLDNMWGKMTEAIASSRKIDQATLNTYADSLATVTDAVNLVDMKMVDGLKYVDEMRDYLKGLCNVDKDDDLNIVSVGEYMQTSPEVPNTKSSKNKIAVYYASGDVTVSDDEGIASDRVVPDILDLAEDDDIQALVLRVNSGGGSAYASEQIWHALEVFKSKGKKFYVSMGDYAASGGYYISSGADKIFAQPLTLTGSIGIFGMIPCFNGLVTDKLGVNIDYVTTNANGAQPNSFYPMTPFVREKMQKMVERGYELFTSRCAEGRHLTQDSIKSIAEGRVWDGVTAHQIGLVDELGSLQDAVAALAKQMEYKKYEVVNYPNAKTDFWEMLSAFNSQMRVKALKEELGQAYPLYMQVKNIKDLDPLQARMEYQIIF